MIVIGYCGKYVFQNISADENIYSLVLDDFNFYHIDAKNKMMM